MRITSIDIAKGLALCSVFLGHFMAKDTVSCQFVYRFHIPLFFFIAGFFFKPMCIRDAIKRIVKNYLVPFIFFWGVTFLCMILCFCFYNVTQTVIQHLHPRALVETFVFGEAKFNRGLWFLYSLALVYIISIMWSKFTLRLSHSNIILCIFSLGVGICVDRMGLNSKNFLPLHLETVPMGIFFYQLGNVGKNIVYSLESRKKSMLPFVLISIFVLTLVWISVNPNVEYIDMHFGQFDPKVIYVSLICIFSILIISIALSKVKCLSMTLSFIGRNSLIFFACEGAVASKIIGAYTTMFDIKLDNHSLILGISMVVIKLLIIIVFLPIITKTLNWSNLLIEKKLYCANVKQ